MIPRILTTTTEMNWTISIFFIVKALSLLGVQDIVCADSSLQFCNCLLKLKSEHKVFPGEVDDRAIGIDEHEKVDLPPLIRRLARLQRLPGLGNNG